MLAGLSLLMFATLPALAQQDVTVNVTVQGVQPSGEAAVAPALLNVVNQPGLGAPIGFSVRTFNAEVCGGIGDPLQEGFQRFSELTQARAVATTPAERDRLDRQIFAQGLKLPQLVTEDFASRGIAKGQSEECDNLIESVTELMQQVSDYLGALQDVKTAILW
jgi:hypothetical protein